MGKTSEVVYHNSPVFMQNLMVSLYGLKLYRQRYKGDVFTRYLDAITDNVSLSEDELYQLQLSKLKTIVKYAYDNVPFYNSEYKRIGVSPEDINELADIKILPTITKTQLQEYPERFISNKFKNKQLIKIFTSGTSGTPLTVYCVTEVLQRNYAFFERLKNWAGVSLKERNITFAGRIIQSPDRDAPPFWRHNYVMNNMLFSSYHLSEKNLPYYIDRINKFMPSLIDSYPSAISVVANYALENNISLCQPKAIITSSETLLESQRDSIEKAFKCKVFDQYGSAEMVANISQCKHGSYHINSDYSLIEFLDRSEKDVIDEAGEMVCTGFINPVMPLIRFKTGDSAVYSRQKCKCGCDFPIVKSIEGRIDDFIIKKDGTKIGRLDPIFKGMKTIKECQIIQNKDYSIMVYIVRGLDFNDVELEKFLSELKKRVGSSMVINVEYLESIPRTSSGKFRAVISRI